MFLAMRRKREIGGIDPFEGIPIPIVMYILGVCLCAAGVSFFFLGWDFQKLFHGANDWRPFWPVVALVSVMPALAGIGLIMFTGHIERLKRVNYRGVGK